MTFLKKYIIKLLPLLPFVLLFFFYCSRELILTLTAALAHELGHLFAMAILGREVKDFRISPGGAVIVSGGELISLPKRLLIYLSGPFLNIVLAVVSYFLSFRIFFIANLSLAVLNLLPILSLDGGEALLCIFEEFMLPDRAYSALRLISVFPLFVLWSFSLGIIFFGGENLSPLALSLTLFVINFVRRN